MKLLLHACCGPCSLEPVRLLQAAGHDLTIAYLNSNIAPADEYERRRAALAAWAVDQSIPVIEGTYNPAAWEATAGRIGEAALEEANAEKVCEPARPEDMSKLKRDVELKTGSRAVSETQTNLDNCNTTYHKNTAPLHSPQARANNSPDRETILLPNSLTLAVDPARREARCRACYRLRFEEVAQLAAGGGFDAIGTTLSVSPYQYTHVIREELGRAAALAGTNALFEDYRPFYDEATRRSRDMGMYRQNYCGCRFSEAEAEAEREQRHRQRQIQRSARLKEHAAEREAEEAARATRKAERQAYANKQAHKRAALKALRNEGRGTSGSQN